MAEIGTNGIHGNFEHQYPHTLGLSPRKIPTHEIRSLEMQEIMSEIPGSFLKWGLFLFFGIILSILAISWLINSPDIVTAPISLTTYNPPAQMIARSSGTIEQFFVNNEDRLFENQPVALIGNQADWDDIKKLDEFIISIIDLGASEYNALNINPPNGLYLGEIQASWLNLLTTFQKFKEYIGQAYIPSKLELLDKQITRQEEYIIELKKQELLYEEDMRLAYNSYCRDSILYHRSNYSISINELERSKQVLIQKQVTFSSLKSSIKNTESSILKMKESRLDLVIQREKEMSQFRSDLNEALQLLKVTLEEWKEKYLLESPINGKITFTSYWVKNQNINTGDVIATVIPDKPLSVLIRARVPVNALGKVKTAQEVNIKLSGFPYMEFGVLKGRIKSLSLVPAEDAYIADIELLNGMKTSYNIEIGFINGMTGTADIITENSRLISRFIKPFISIVK